VNENEEAPPLLVQKKGRGVIRVGGEGKPVVVVYPKDRGGRGEGELFTKETTCKRAAPLNS